MPSRPPHHSYAQPRDGTTKRFVTPYQDSLGKFRQSLVDLDGDGKPDAVVEVPADVPASPRNAMLGR